MPKHRASGPQPPLPSRDGPRCHLAECYAAALRAVDGRAAVRGALAARPPSGPVWLIAVGKAAAAMTLGALDVLGSTCQGGLLVDKAAPLDPRPYAGRGIECLTGGHPVPTQASLDAGDRLLRALARTPRDTTLLFLLSGGGSSLVEVPVAGLGLVEIQRLNQWLLGSGWPITSMNRVRTAVSRIKGGGLLAALPDRPVRVLAISDVPNDAPAVIGSGLLVPALDLATQVVRLDLPAWLRDCVNQGLARRPEPRALGPPVEVVANLAMAKAAAAGHARAVGYQVQVHPELLVGDAARRGRELACLVRDGAAGVQVWGGETTVRLPPEPGRGGRNQHLALSAALMIADRTDCLLLAAGTDGSDGPGADAGALVDGGTTGRGAADGFDAVAALARADSGSLLAASGDLIHTGPTGTNVMDLVLGLKR